MAVCWEKVTNPSIPASLLTASFSEQMLWLLYCMGPAIQVRETGMFFKSFGQKKKGEEMTKIREKEVKSVHNKLSKESCLCPICHFQVT
jgi:hypothetical protein